ncbi:metalloregulator ArsR/SmtB family transcription factor, partial [Micromonospora sp. ATA32]|nr:metalloregulator ArsR/SmtB family transcription factor [Micromonospora sp. ATA32]
MELVFKALADPTRRLLLDRLRERNGQTLRELCEHLAMARQSATQHLDILVRANLVTAVRRGRERLHYLNPAPIHEIEERWISGFDKPRLWALSAIKHQAEEYGMTSVPTYVYVTYIHATAEQVWRALTDADLTARYWGHANVSDWQPGSAWEHQRTDGSGVADVVCKVLTPSRRRAWPSPSRTARTKSGSRPVVTFLVEPHQDIVRLTVTHENLANSTCSTASRAV